MAIKAPTTDQAPEVKYPREPGQRAIGAENPHNGWYWKTL